MTWLAADPAAGDLSLFAQYGVLGIVAAGLIWFAKGTVARERERADRLEIENRRLNELIAERVMPVLTTATRALEQSANLLTSLQREREARELSMRGEQKGN